MNEAGRHVPAPAHPAAPIARVLWGAGKALSVIAVLLGLYVAVAAERITTTSNDR